MHKNLSKRLWISIKLKGQNSALFLSGTCRENSNWLLWTLWGVPRIICNRIIPYIAAFQAVFSSVLFYMSLILQSVIYRCSMYINVCACALIEGHIDCSDDWHRAIAMGHPKLPSSILQTYKRWTIDEDTPETVKMVCARKKCAVPLQQSRKNSVHWIVKIFIINSISFRNWKTQFAERRPSYMETHTDTHNVSVCSRQSTTM